MSDWRQLPGVYFLSNSDGHVKIGYSTNPARRVSALATGTRYDHVLLAVAVGEPRSAEATYHRLFASSRYNREWFLLTNEVANEIRRVQHEYQNLGAPPVPSPRSAWHNRDPRVARAARHHGW